MTAQTFETFLASIPGIARMDRNELARYFVYYLTAPDVSQHAKPAQVALCFREAEMEPYDDVRFYLNRASQKKKGAKPLLTRSKSGYRLERSERERIEASLSGVSHKRQTETALRSLIGQLATTSERQFLDEAVKCYEVEAFRAAIILTWLLTIDHLYEFIVAKHIASFNIELSKIKDKRVKVSAITAKDDFSDIPEGKFIEISRASGIISNDVRKILDQKLGIRNSYAHPSSLTLSPVKASEFIQDLVENVLLKYPL